MPRSQSRLPADCRRQNEEEGRRRQTDGEEATYKDSIPRARRLTAAGIASIFLRLAKVWLENYTVCFCGFPQFKFC